MNSHHDLFFPNEVYLLLCANGMTDGPSILKQKWPTLRKMPRRKRNLYTRNVYDQHQQRAIQRFFGTYVVKQL